MSFALGLLETTQRTALGVIGWLVLGWALISCSADQVAPNPSPSSGGMTNAPTSGGATQFKGDGGAIASGGANSSGGAATGGAPPNQGGSSASKGGAATGGGANGGAATGGGANGGMTNGGTPSGGTATGSVVGGASKGGTASGGATAGGAGKGGTGTGGAANGGTAPGGSANGGSNVGGNSHTGVWKIMPLGDSITGTTCYPQLLSQTFKNGSHTNFQLVGTNLNNQSCSGAPTVQTEGHGNYFVTYLTTDSPPQSGKGTLAELKTWAAEKPDVVLMHYGTNDCWGGSIAASSIIAAYLTVITQFRSQNPNVVFFVSKIIPMSPSGCSTCATQVTSLNALITDTWALTNSTASSPTYVIDNWTGFNSTTDTSDGVHPNPAGAQKMATTTAAAVVAAHLSGF
jgi:lysophospholipase L1-like esterase